jgi:LmbE family N-acetylglucosaminyl deacetylase
MPRAFAVAAHPDDIEFLMSGTLMRLGERGYELHYMNLANGCCGSRELDREQTAAARLEEARAAAASIGATFHPPLVADLEIFYDRPTLGRLASVMRAVAPEILLIHSPDDYMEDHMNACRLAITAAFARGMPNFPVEPPRPNT